MRVGTAEGDGTAIAIFTSQPQDCGAQTKRHSQTLVG